MMQSNGRKFQDPARVIHNDSMRKKYANGGGQFLLNGIHHNGTNGKVGNGHVPHATYSHQGSRVNINVNPMTELERRAMLANDNMPQNEQVRKLLVINVLPPSTGWYLYLLATLCTVVAAIFKIGVQPQTRH